MKSDIVLGIDLGTSYFKLGLFDRDGELRGLGRVSVPKDAPEEGRCELPTERFRELLRSGLAQACKRADARPSDVRAAAYSSQANSFVLLDDTGKPLTPLVLWPDARATDIAPRVRELWERDDFLETTGLGFPYAQMAVAKLWWFRQHEPELWARTNRIMTISDYLVFALTGEAVGDGGTASLLGLMDLRRLDWWDDALRMLELRREQLSQPLRPGTLAGRVSAEGERRFGLPRGIPLAVGSLDHYVAALGAGIGHVADASESTGTVLACVRTCGTSEDEPACSPESGRHKSLSLPAHLRPGCCTGPWYDEGRCAQLAFSENGASALEWYQKRYAPGLAITDLVRAAEAVGIGSGGLVALPRPDQHGGLEGFRGSSSSHGHAHFVRAMMESTAASLAELIDFLYPDARPERIVATGGGARSDLWLQIKADLLGAELVAVACEEPACLGAAMLAAVAAGWFAELEGARRAFVSVRDRFRPTPSGRAAYAEWLKRYAEHTRRG